MKELSDYIEDMKLVDLQLEDALFTWFKGDQHVATSKIDRILISEEWDEKFQNLKQIPLKRLTSDHSHVALLGGSWESNKSYFKFKNWWLESEGFIDRIREWWSSFNFTGKPDYRLACKLKALRLKEWRNGEEGNLGFQRKKLLGKLAELEAEREDRILTNEESVKKYELMLKYGELIKKEISWRQKSRAL